MEINCRSESNEIITPVCIRKFHLPVRQQTKESIIVVINIITFIFLIGERPIEKLNNPQISFVFNDCRFKLTMKMVLWNCRSESNEIVTPVCIKTDFIFLFDSKRIGKIFLKMLFHINKQQLSWLLEKLSFDIISVKQQPVKGNVVMKFLWNTGVSPMEM